MISSNLMRAILRRLSAVVLIATPLAAWPFLPVALRGIGPALGVAGVAAAAGVALLTRRSGRLIGLGAGVVSGLCLALVLAPPIPGLPAWAGWAASAIAFGLIGHLSGFGRPVPIRLPERIAPNGMNGRTASPPPRLGAAGGGHLSGNRNATVLESLQGVLDELCRFLHREAD